MVHESYGSSPNGIILEDYIVNYFNNGASAYRIRNTFLAVVLFASYPYKSNGATTGPANNVAITVPLFFKSSLKIEVKSSSNAASNNFSIVGGLK